LKNFLSLNLLRQSAFICYESIEIKGNWFEQCEN